LRVWRDGGSRSSRAATVTVVSAAISLPPVFRLPVIFSENRGLVERAPLSKQGWSK
jgi:hypothetical protein